MKKTINLYVSIFLLLVTACDYLDVVPAEFTTDEQVWSDINLAEKTIGRLYNVLPNNIVDDMWAATDEVKHHWENPVVWKYNQGAWGPTDIPSFNIWAGRYRDIRRANLILQNLESVPIPDNKVDYYKDRIPRYLAEVRFLRAYFYFELFRCWGPVPLSNDIYDANNIQGLEIPRNSLDEFTEFLVTELDDIAKVLPLSYKESEYGRATRGAALALKSRFLLYIASPLFNGNTMYAEIKNKDGKQLFPQTYDREKWLAAANAAKELLDMKGTYDLAKSALYPDNPVENYATLFYETEFKESIFVRLQGATNSVETALLPNGAGIKGQGKFSVAQELIDCYETKDGYPINHPQSGYTTEGFWDGTMWDGLAYTQVTKVSNMYKDRDPRFYASIFFHRANWRRNIVKRHIKLAWWGGNKNTNSDGWPKKGTNCESGYNIRKWCSPNVDKNTGKGTARRNYPIFRFAEAYLNYAEAMNEYLDAPDQTIYDAVNTVRARAGMPPLPIIPEDKTKEGMRNRIRNERRVEFAFERHRFFDVRRWMIATDVDNKPIHGLNARPSQKELEATGLNINSEEAGEACFYKVVELQNRTFEAKHYLFPIPQVDIDRAPYLVQNYGWELSPGAE